MLSVFSVKRYSASLTVYVDNEGMHLTVQHPFRSKELQFSQWNVEEYPQAFIDSATQSLKGYKGFHTCFTFAPGNSFIDGRFGARTESDEWIDFIFTMDQKVVCMVLRRAEVVKIVKIINQYWNR